MKLGFIGLGIMGTPMALRLAKAGHALHVTTIGPVAEETAQAGRAASGYRRAGRGAVGDYFYHGS